MDGDKIIFNGKPIKNSVMIGDLGIIYNPDFKHDKYKNERFTFTMFSQLLDELKRFQQMYPNTILTTEILIDLLHKSIKHYEPPKAE